MSRSHKGLALSIILLASELLAGAQTPPAAHQQNGIVGTSAVNSSDGMNASSSPAGGNGEGSGTSSWSAGRTSFGIQTALQQLNKGADRKSSNVAPGSGSSSWNAGRGAFGGTSQQGGIWRERGGQPRSMSGRSANGAMSGLYAPALPNQKSAGSAMSAKPLAPAHSTSRQAALSQPRNKTDSGIVARQREGSSRGPAGPAHSYSVGSGLRGRPIARSGGRSNSRLGAKPSRPASDTESPTSFQPQNSHLQ